MDKNQIKDALKAAKESSQKRNFKQSIDLILNLKNIDLKKNNVDVFIQLHKEKGKKPKICGLVGAELFDQAKKTFDHAVLSDDFEKYDKKQQKKLASQYDFFVAQANLMADIAKIFGRVFGPKGKMPNPKAGCVVPPNANLEAVSAKLSKTIRVQAKNNNPVLMAMVGTEDLEEDIVMDNIQTIYNALIHALPSEENNIKSVYLKLTMGNPIKVGDKSSTEEKEPEKKKETKAKETEEKAE